MLKIGAEGELKPIKLTNAYRASLDVQLNFPFKFYGLPVNVVSITTGGFINLGISGDPNKSPTKFIAPLMANFHTMKPDSTVMFAQNRNMLAVEWHKVELMDQPSGT